LEVHYRWHLYFGYRVCVRLVEWRATGQFLKVQAPTGAVISIAGWMLDPMVCGGMALGAPRVELTTLLELKRLLMVKSGAADSRSDVTIALEEHNDPSQITDGNPKSTDELVVRRQKAGGIESPQAGQGHSWY
jgi:hypothetical protein